MPRRGASAAVVVACLLILTQVLTVAAATTRGSSPGNSGTAAPIEKALQKQLAAGKAVQLLVEFDAKADFKPARKLTDRTKRGQAVLKALTATATRSQAGARSLVAKTKGVSATSYWLTNVLVVEATGATTDGKALDKLAKQLAKIPGVTSVRAPKVYPLVKPVETKIAILAAAG
ncbi:MAG: hypothetical protein ABIQ58_00100, partial [Candidatus Limnocylindrales bacterium]